MTKRHLLPTPKPPALVLLGYHGVGKDTLCTLLQSRFSDVGNIKFGSLNKRLVAEVFNLCPSYLEDRDFRATFDCMKTFGYTGCKLSLIDLLDVLFQGMQSSTPAAANLSAACHRYALEQAKEYELPVFTDIRNWSEIQAVLDNFDAVVVWLRDDSIEAGLSDDHIDAIAEAHANVVQHRLAGSPLSTLEELVANVKKTIENH
jgi:hypothetical protein